MSRWLLSAVLKALSPVIVRSFKGLSSRLVYCVLWCGLWCVVCVLCPSYVWFVCGVFFDVVWCGGGDSGGGGCLCVVVCMFC